MRIFLFLLFICIISINVISVYGEFCPINCRCNDVPKTINCSSQGSEMFSVPYLDSVEILDLSNNKFFEVPKLILFSSKLRKLNLSRNSLSSLPSNLSLLSELRVLDLSDNNFSKANDLLGLEQLKNLEVLYLSRNPLSNLDGLKSDSLRILRVDDCKIEELRNNSLDALPQLTILKLSENPLRLIDHPKNKMLTFLDISKCGLESLNATAFSGLINLVYLDVSKNPIQKNIMGNLKHLELEALVIDNPHEMIEKNRSQLPMLKYFIPSELETIKYFAFSDKRSSEFSMKSLAESLKNIMIGIEKYLIHNNISSQDSSQSYSSYVPSLIGEGHFEKNDTIGIQSQSYSTKITELDTTTTYLPSLSYGGHKKKKDDPIGFQPQISNFKRVAYILLFIGTLGGVVCIPWLLHERREGSTSTINPIDSQPAIQLEAMSSDGSPQESHSQKSSPEVLRKKNGSEPSSTSSPPYPIKLSSESYVIHQQSHQSPPSACRHATNSSYLPQFETGYLSHSEQPTALQMPVPSTNYLQPSQLVHEINPSHLFDYGEISRSSSKVGATDVCIQDIGFRKEFL